MTFNSVTRIVPYWPDHGLSASVRTCPRHGPPEGQQGTRSEWVAPGRSHTRSIIRASGEEQSGSRLPAADQSDGVLSGGSSTGLAASTNRRIRPWNDVIAPASADRPASAVSAAN